MSEPKELSAAMELKLPWRKNIARLSNNEIAVAHIVAADGSMVAQLAIFDGDRTEEIADLILNAVNEHG